MIVSFPLRAVFMRRGAASRGAGPRVSNYFSYVYYRVRAASVLTAVLRQRLI